MFKIFSTKLKGHPLYLRHRHFILYVFIAFSGVALDIISFNICYLVFNIDERLSQLIGGHIGFINNFFLNAYFNFKKTNKLFIRFLSYYLTSLVGMLIRDQLMLFFAIKQGYNPSIVQFFALGFVAMGQFVFNKFITFGSRKTSPPPVKE